MIPTIFCQVFMVLRYLVLFLFNIGFRFQAAQMAIMDLEDILGVLEAQGHQLPMVI